jgi:outer membrane protein OmpA-like peptidoglycan-associated protein
MKNKPYLKNGSRFAWSAYISTLKCITLTVLIASGTFSGLYAQSTTAKKELYTKPSFWIGAAAGANFNFYRGTTQQFNEEFSSPAAFHHGKGARLYMAPLIEFHRPESKWGGMLQIGYDGRGGKFNRVISPCNCPADLKTSLAYITVEPSLRFAPFRSAFYVYGGPRLAFNSGKSFTYSQKTNPEIAEQVANPDIRGDFSNVNGILLSMQIGAGYDIDISSQEKRTQYVLSPFVAFHPYFGQSPRTTETWTLTTIRAGAALKIGRGRKAADVVPEPSVDFTIISPKNIPVERRVRETFPIRNYVFFDLGSNEIPERYVLLRKDQVKDFKEDQLEVFTPKHLSGRSDRAMIVYYNVLNIVGDRLGKNPDAKITLVGSSQAGADQATIMAKSVKHYLTSVFGIDSSRIAIEGRVKPKIPSEQPGGTVDLTLLREGDHRVSIESQSPAMLMEFQSGPDAPLKPVEFVATQNAPLDSYVTFNVAGAKEAFTSWSLEITDEKGVSQFFGPYMQEKISIPGKSILGARPQGDFKVRMIGQTKSGKTMVKEQSVRMNLWTPGTDEQGIRYSVIFEFNESKSIAIYEKYLTEIVAAKIPKNGTVIIHGYSDIIGDSENNLKLSWDRADDVKGILAKALKTQKRDDVKFEVLAFGENEELSPFNNKYPEERFYNRTVIIDIIAPKAK